MTRISFSKPCGSLPQKMYVGALNQHAMSRIKKAPKSFEKHKPAAKPVAAPVHWICDVESRPFVPHLYVYKDVFSNGEPKYKLCIAAFIPSNYKIVGIEPAPTLPPEVKFVVRLEYGSFGNEPAFWSCEKSDLPSDESTIVEVEVECINERKEINRKKGKGRVRYSDADSTVPGPHFHE